MSKSLPTLNNSSERTGISNLFELKPTKSASPINSTTFDANSLKVGES